MGHVDTLIDGKSYPSVTQVVGLLDKSLYLVPWAGKHGTLKSQALVDYVIGNSAGSDYGVGQIPDKWFEENRLERSDFWKSHEDLTKEAQERGTKFHEGVELALKIKYNVPVEGTIPVDDLVAVNNDEYITAVAKWTDIVGFVPTAFERYVQSKIHLYGGTFDCLGTIGGKAVLPDWKRTNQISAAYVIQLAGYIGALAEETGEWIDDGRIIRPYGLKTPAKEDGFKETAEGFKWSFKGSRIYVEERRYTGMKHYFGLFLKLRELWDFVNKRGMWER